MITGIKKKNKLTEIWFDETGSAVNIRTYNTDLKNRLTAYAAKYPAHCRLTDDDECGCLTFEIDRRRFSVRLTAPYSEDRRSKAKETMTAVNQRRKMTISRSRYDREVLSTGIASIGLWPPQSGSAALRPADFTQGHAPEYPNFTKEMI